jgi:hypothetical protein
MKKLFSGALVLIAAHVSAVHATTVYTFQGSLDQYGAGTSNFVKNTFASYGVTLNQTYTITIETNQDQQGRSTTESGAIYYPFQETLTSPTHQQNSIYRAFLVPGHFSIVPPDYTSYPINQYALNHTYWSDDLNEGGIDAHLFAGPVAIVKTGEYGDDSVFVSSWQVGESLDWSLHYDDGSYNASASDDFWAFGTLHLVSVSQVPIPAAGWLFLSGVAVLATTKRRRMA